MPAPRSLDDWLRLQERVHGTGIDLSLERVREVAQRLGLLRALGHRVGSFTSPHLIRYHERIRVDGAEASDAGLIAAFEAIEAARGPITLTFFEFNTLAALQVFRARGVEFAVLEVGLGGRLDAVNIVDAEAAIVCSIGLDHADWLGTDIEGIGREKAGVLRAGALAVLADPDMTPSVEAEARRIGSRLVRAGSHYRWQAGPEQGRWHFQTEGLVLADLPLPALPGNRQLANAAAAIVTLQRMGVLQARHAPQVARALAGLALPGRLQILPGRVQWVLDVAHNEAAARVLAQSLAERPVAGRTLCVSGILADKDVDAIARALESTVDAWFLCGIAAPRGLAAGELAARSPVFGGATLCADVAAGMRAAAAAARPGDRILVCGSFLVVSPALALLGLY